jgi:hypothetical protein
MGERDRRGDRSGRGERDRRTGERDLSLSRSLLLTGERERRRGGDLERDLLRVDLCQGDIGGGEHREGKKIESWYNVRVEKDVSSIQTSTHCLDGYMI